MSGSKLDPYSLPKDFRAYVYDAVIIAWETKRVNISAATFNAGTLRSACGIDVQMLEKLDDIRKRDRDNWPTTEFLVFHRVNRGYKCLFTAKNSGGRQFRA